MSEQPNETESFAEMLAQQESCAPKLKVGQKISGKVIDISNDSVFVNVGVKQDGVLDRAEILDAEGNLAVGPNDIVEAWITSISPEGIRLSRSMTGSGVEALQEAKDAAIPVEGRVKAVCKGGYQIETMGKIAFCPGSQMEQAPGEDAEAAVGRQMQFLITKLENNGRNIVVSRRALVDRERQANLDKLLASIKVGDTLEGVVRRLAPYGAFVELAPLIEGLVHISELSWSRVGSPDEAVSVDEPVRVKVTSITKDDKGQTRIGLSIRQAQGDPWEGAESRFKPGDIVEGIVRRFAPFGAFVEIAPGIEGLAHISELSWERRVAKPEEVLAPGDAVSVKIKEFNPENRRISLSIKDAQGNPWDEAAEKFASGARVSGTVESKNQHGLFVRLAPGIIGLLPQGALMRPNLPEALAKAAPGDTVEVIVRSVDPVSRRISLNPVTAEAAPESEAEDQGWKKHASLKPARDEDQGVMAQALKRAFEKK